MLDVQKTIQNLIGLEGEDIHELHNDIICAFDTTEDEIIVTSPGCMNGCNLLDGVHSAYENREDAPIINFKIENGKIIDAWEA